MTAILCVGHSTQDHMFRVVAFPDEPTKTVAHDYLRTCGGIAANSAVAVSRLGATARLASPVGDDETGRELIAALRAHGVDTSAMRVVREAQTSVSAIVVDRHGERMIVARRGDALRRAGPFESAWLDGADCVLADVRCAQWTEAALTLARMRGMPSVFDGDVAPRDELARLSKHAQWAVFSEQGLASLHGEASDDALRALVRSGAEVGVVTLGGRGVRWTRGDAVHSMPAFKVSVVDTTGAGDVFHGALAVALAERMDDAQALRFASAAAALKCTNGFGAAAAPSRDELDGFLSRG